ERNGRKIVGSSTRKVKATFRDMSGAQPADPEAKTVLSVEREVDVRPRIVSRAIGERSSTELMKLCAALLIAVFGLVAGAQDQLVKLDILPGIVAVFLVGFGADTIKNLLTSKS